MQRNSNPGWMYHIFCISLFSCSPKHALKGFYNIFFLIPLYYGKGFKYSNVLSDFLKVVHYLLPEEYKMCTPTISINVFPSMPQKTHSMPCEPPASLPPHNPFYSLPVRSKTWKRMKTKILPIWKCLTCPFRLETPFSCLYIAQRNNQVWRHCVLSADNI